jgi:hypothetical protein
MNLPEIHQHQQYLSQSIGVWKKFKKKILVFTTLKINICQTIVILIYPQILKLIAYDLWIRFRRMLEVCGYTSRIQHKEYLNT